VGSQEEEEEVTKDISLGDWFLAIIIILLALIASVVIAESGKPMTVIVKPAPAPAPKYFTTSDFAEEKSPASNRILEEWDAERERRNAIQDELEWERYQDE
jgi:hypothetical protein